LKNEVKCEYGRNLNLNAQMMKLDYGDVLINNNENNIWKLNSAKLTIRDEIRVNDDYLWNAIQVRENIFLGLKKSIQVYSENSHSFIKILPTYSSTFSFCLTKDKYLLAG
jgi:hypothetical protein